MDLAAHLEADLAVLPQLLGPLMVLLAAAVVLVFLQPIALIQLPLEGKDLQS